MINHPSLFRRLWHSAVGWSWAFNGLRLASGVLLLPLLLHLPASDFGFYYVFLSLVALAPLLDMGFLASIDRAISYAMGGATELRAQGMVPTGSMDAPPNFPLLWQLLDATRTLYRYLSFGVILILGTWGTYVVSLRVDETSNPQLTWLAWILTLLSGVFEMYSGWWNVYLRGLNQVVLCSRILALAFGLKFILSCALLLSGAGLLSVPVAGLAASWLQRHLSRRFSLKFLSRHPSGLPAKGEVHALIRILWPNSWRMGCLYLSAYLATNANTFLCMKFFGLQATAEYGLSLQIVSICATMAAVWVQVKWPMAFQLRARGNSPALRRLIHPRIWLLIVTFLLLAGCALVFGRPLLDWMNDQPWIHGRKNLVPTAWLLLLFANAFLELQFTIWGTVILTENRLPFLWPAVATNLSSLVLAVCLLQLTSLEIGAFVLAPLITGCMFNYWYWPREGAKSLQSTLFQFLFSRPA